MLYEVITVPSVPEEPLVPDVPLEPEIDEELARCQTAE